MEVEAVELLRVELPLREPFVSATGTLALRPLVLVRVLTDAGEGLGECPALAEPTYSEEYADGAEAVLAEHLVPRLLAAPPPASQGAGAPEPAPWRAGDGGDGGDCSGGDGAGETVWSILARLEAVRGHPMAKSALEMALLDAALRHEGRPLASFFGVQGRRVQAGATLGLQRDAARAVEAAGAAVRAGYRRLKLKIAPGSDLAPARAVRAAFPDVALVVDANGSYRRSDEEHARLLDALDALGLSAIEQPLAPDDLAGNVLRSFELVTPVLLDESITGGAALEAAIALGFDGAVSLKQARLGGLVRAATVLERCREVGLSAAIGGMLESGIGRRAALALGALDGFDLPGELSPTDRYLAEDLLPPLLLVDGELAVPDGRGVAPAPEPAALARRVVRRRTWRAE